jgi:hypothetical protein
MRSFQAGGTVREDATYVERKADQELVDALLEGEFCYVLAPRQIGKSSLRLRALSRIRKQGVRAASVDLTSIGTSGISDDEWYFSLVDEIATQLELDRDPASFWEAHGGAAPVRRFMRFLREEVLSAISAPVVISIDEIDAVLALPFESDDFFAAIRAAYNARAEDPTYARLTFCLFGVATPAELIENATRTPFNIGRGIRLLDFTRAEALALLPGLAEAGGDARGLLDAVLDWTSGHPYMTQRICVALTQERPEEGAFAAERVRMLVWRLFLERGRTEDPNLAYAEKRFQKTDPALKTQMLRIYRRLLHGDTISLKGDDPAQQELRLAGLVAERRDEDGGRLMIRNQIFAEVFDLRWVDEHDSTNPLSEPVAAWLRWKRGDDFLLRGAALEVVLAWAKGREDLSPEEHEFLRLSALHVERTRSAWQRRKLALAISGLLAIVGFLITLTIFNRRELDAEVRYVEQVEAARRQAEERFEAARLELDIRSRQAKQAQEESERKATEAAERAAALMAQATDLDRQAEAAVVRGRGEATRVRKKADDAHKEARAALQRAAQEREVAVVAQDLAAKAMNAASRSQEAASVAQKTLDSERAARQLAESLLALEKSNRERVEKELRATGEELRVCEQERDRSSPAPNPPASPLR